MIENYIFCKLNFHEKKHVQSSKADAGVIAISHSGP
jgi:hypothetical protein